MDANVAQLQSCMYQYSRAIYRSIKDLIDPYVDHRDAPRVPPRRALRVRADDGASRRGSALLRAPGPHAVPGHPPLLPDHRAGAGRLGGAGGRRRSGRVHRGADRGRRCSTAASPAARRRRARARRASARRCRGATTARRTSISSARAAGSRPRRVGTLAAAGSSVRARRPVKRCPTVGSPCAMSHDTDKLIRQLSLVAFLMAERRPLTARDVKGNVEGYSEMSDEAFARRFYSDRAELTALGVPLHSQRDEFTGEELYTLRSEHYFLDRLELDDDELAALQTALYPLEGKFAYAEPLRLALQNLALGRPGFRHAPTGDRGARPRQRARLLARARRPALEARGGDLEAAHDPVPLLVARARARDRAHAQPVRAAARRGRLVRGRPGPRPRRDPHVPRLADPLATSASRRAASATSGSRPTSTSRRTACRGPGRSASRRHGADRGAGRHRLVGAPDARRRRHARGRRLRDAVRAPRAARPLDPAAERPRGPARARRAARRGRRRRSRLLRERHTGAPPRPARERRVDAQSRRRRAAARGPVAPERFGVLQALLAHLLASCGDETRRPPRRRRARGSASRSRARSSRSTLSLLNLVNFGGGCYTVYAEVDEETGRVRVDKELYGDVFRKPPKLTPLEARAIRLAIEYVGPTIAADAHTPLERVRRKLEETFGQFELAQTPRPRGRRRRGGRSCGRSRTAPTSAGSSRSST